MEELTKVVTELHAYGLKQHTIVKMVKDIFASVDNAEVKISPKSVIKIYVQRTSGRRGSKTKDRRD